MNSLRCWAEIDVSALAFNLSRLRSLVPASTEIIGVVKADAYGHGLFGIAHALDRQGVRTLAVANITEASIAARAAPRADILLLSPLLPEEIPVFVRSPRWIATVSNHVEFISLQKEAARRGKKVRVHLKLDTGMGRLGGFPDEIFPLLERIHGSSWIAPTALYSHLGSADLSLEQSRRQLKRLQAFVEKTKTYGWKPLPVHLQNSAGALRLKTPSWIQGVRPGLALYGVPFPSSVWRQKFGPHPLRPALSWKTRIALIRETPRGTSVSYGAAYRTRARTRIGILSAGYADGISRKLSNRGHVLIHGKKCRILGRVTMDMTMVDVTRVPRARWNDPVVLIGRDGKEEITANDVAAWAETIPYEVLCNISKRVPRFFLSELAPKKLNH